MSTSVIRVGEILQRFPNDAESIYNELIEDFSCAKNPIIESYLKETAFKFEKRNSSSTRLIMDSNLQNPKVLGYYSIGLAVLDCKEHMTEISKTKRKKVKSGMLNLTHLPVMMVGHLGRSDYSYQTDKLDGNRIMTYIMEEYRLLSENINGVRGIILEHESGHDKLAPFYESHKFSLIGSRESNESKEGTLDIRMYFG